MSALGTWSRVIACRAALTLVALMLLAPLAVHLVGLGAYVVTSNSMTPALSSGDVIITKKPANLEKGQIVVVRAPHYATTHRLIAAPEAGYVLTQGDANHDADSPVPQSWVRGKGLFCIPYAGLGRVWLHERTFLPLGLSIALLVLIARGALPKRVKT